ncbi:hypothetical protein FHS47_000242 [Lutibacter sp. SG786]|nr:hypothetical protein [Luteibacter sp. SG786]
MPPHRAHVGAASLCVGAASAAMGARGKLARCRGIAGRAGSHREHWAIVFLGNRGQVSSPPWRLLQQPRESQYLTLPYRRACPTVVPAKAGTQRLKRGRSPQTEQTTPRHALHNTPPHRPMPAAVALAAMSGVEGGRAEKARQGAGQDGPPSSPRHGGRVEDPRPDARVRRGVSHKTLAAQRLSCRKERRKSSRRGRRLPAFRKRHRRRCEAEQASQTYEAKTTRTASPTAR